MKLKEFSEKIVNKFGADKQIDIAIEEMAELIKALCKFNRRNEATDRQEVFRNIEEELADVVICMSELCYIFDCKDEVRCNIARKIKRSCQRYGIKNSDRA